MHAWRSEKDILGLCKVMGTWPLSSLFKVQLGVVVEVRYNYPAPLFVFYLDHTVVFILSRWYFKVTPIILISVSVLSNFFLIRSHGY